MKRQRGVALITVLLVVALASLVTAGLVLRQQLSIRSSTNQLLARQAWHFALGGEALRRPFCGATSRPRRILRAAPTTSARPGRAPSHPLPWSRVNCCCALMTWPGASI